MYIIIMCVCVCLGIGYITLYVNRMYKCMYIIQFRVYGADTTVRILQDLQFVRAGRNSEILYRSQTIRKIESCIQSSIGRVVVKNWREIL